MIKFDSVLKCINYNITSVSRFNWDCFGSDAFNFEATNYLKSTISGTYDISTGEVLHLEAWDQVNNREYRWIHPDYVEVYKAVYAARSLPFNISFDTNKFIDLDVVDDIMEKSIAIFSNKEYDTDVTVTLNLNDDEILVLALAAHRANITLNAYVAQALDFYIKELHNEI